MNVSYPYLIPGAQSNPASFVASSTGVLGSYDKSVDGRTQITVDYSAILPAIVISSYAFRVKPGGSPQLWIDQADLAAPPTTLTFFVEGGIAGRVYEVTINANLASGETRSDVLTVNVLGDDCSCGYVIRLPMSGVGGVTSGDGSLIVNTAPRFFVSGTTPVGANVLDRWYDTASGNTYDFISDGITRFWVISGGGSGGGGGGGTVNLFNITPIHPDGVTTTFNLTTTTGKPVAITGSSTLFVSVDGVWQDGTTQYTARDNQIQFIQAPFADSQVFMLWFAPPSSAP